MAKKEEKREREGFYSGRLGRAIEGFLFSRPSDPTGDIFGLSSDDDDFFVQDLGTKEQNQKGKDHER